MISETIHGKARLCSDLAVSFMSVEEDARFKELSVSLEKGIEQFQEGETSSLFI
jgi:hypothetical protein